MSFNRPIPKGYEKVPQQSFSNRSYESGVDRFNRIAWQRAKQQGIPPSRFSGQRGRESELRLREELKRLMQRDEQLHIRMQTIRRRLRLR